MNLNRIELRKIIYDYNCISNRLLQANFEDYNSVLKKFLNFISNTEIINDYIKDCGDCCWDIDKIMEEVQNSYGHEIFVLGDSYEEEVRNIYAILNHIVQHNTFIYAGIAMGYSNSTKYQDMVKGFNERVVNVLIRHIEQYLTKIGMDMGIDEKITYNISVKNGQVNIANDNSRLEATNKVSSVSDELNNLINNIRILSENQGLSDEEKNILDCNLENISEEFKREEPRKKFLESSVSVIKVMKGTVEFGAAIAALIQFIQLVIK
nr:hypothetical protein [Catenibacterium mitsuokai]